MTYPLRHILFVCLGMIRGGMDESARNLVSMERALSSNVLVKSGMMQPKKLWPGNPWWICLKKSGPAV